MSTPELQLEYCGEWFTPDVSVPFDIGREADLTIDDNPYLHRKFLRISAEDGIWWLYNVGSLLSATVCDTGGGVQSWLSPGNRIPILFRSTTIVFTAGPTTYEILANLNSEVFESHQVAAPETGEQTIGLITFTQSQKQLIVALCEPMLRREGTGFTEIPSTVDAASRLGWAVTRFNRKLDNVCDKLDRIGVKGLRGGPKQLATNRRARLVEYAVTTRLVTAADLALLDITDDAE
ncbi:hypothetical protein V5R04_10620 [Jonesiaceae bacterium BS-20]|uniref:Uncharacterized protein n=1 Tax=Jonesiaceae bacterium BS-20 TaxID=3120821 RepID=A0AAU7DTQ2_9MICO